MMTLIALCYMVAPLGCVIVAFLLPMPWRVIFLVLVVAAAIPHLNYYLYRYGGYETIAFDEDNQQLLILRHRRLYGRKRVIPIRDIVGVDVSEQLLQRHTDYNPQGCILISLRDGKGVACGRSLNLGESRQLVEEIRKIL